MLLLDCADVYGSGHASFSLAGIEGSTDPDANPHASRATSDMQAGRKALPVGCTLQPFATQPTAGGLPIQHVQCYSAHGADLGSKRSYILDLAPKVRAHHV